MSQMLTKIKRFAQHHGCHVWFVAHPRQVSLCELLVVSQVCSLSDFVVSNSCTVGLALLLICMILVEVHTS